VAADANRGLVLQHFERHARATRIRAELVMAGRALVARQKLVGIGEALLRVVTPEHRLGRETRSDKRGSEHATSRR
jgi:hypothetical protein